MAQAKLTRKQTALLTAIGDSYFSFFDDGIVAGSGIWHDCMSDEIAGNDHYDVSASPKGVVTIAAALVRKGYLRIENQEEGDWVALTELGAEKARELAGTTEATPETAETAPETAPVPEQGELDLIGEAPAETAEENFSVEEWEDEGTEWIRTTFSDGSYTLRRRRRVSGSWRTDFWGAEAGALKQKATTSRAAKAARAEGRFLHI